MEEGLTTKACKWMEVKWCKQIVKIIILQLLLSTKITMETSSTPQLLTLKLSLYLSRSLKLSLSKQPISKRETTAGESNN